MERRIESYKKFNTKGRRNGNIRKEKVISEREEMGAEEVDGRWKEGGRDGRRC